MRATLFWLLFAVPVAALSQTDTAAKQPVRVIGVFDSRTGEPIAGAQVIDVLTGTFATTTVTGTASLGFVSFRGSGAMVEVRSIGYQPKSVLLAKGDTTPVTEVLDGVVTLPAMTTTESYRINRDDGKWEGFARRCAIKRITCYNDETLANHPGSTVAEVLRSASAVRVKCSGNGTNSQRIQGRTDQSLPTCNVAGVGRFCSVQCPPGCYPSWFIDGFLYQPFGSRQKEQTYSAVQNMLGPSQIKGIEVYAWNESMPLKYDTGCAAIVVWTK
jgi:hypothetical protein